MILGLVFTLTVIDKEGQYFWVVTIFLVLIRTFLIHFYSLDKGGVARHYLGFCMGSTEPIGHAL